MMMNPILLPLCLVLVGGATAAAAATARDEAEIRGIVGRLEADEPDAHVSPRLDWENAFGIRYADLRKRDVFYGAVVKPQFKAATASTLEIRLQFPAPTVAVADAYWHVVGQVYAGQTKAGPDRWGRTTYIFRKANGTWTEVIERVADLRLPYYKHLDAMPAAAAVPEPILKAYAGRYRNASTDVVVAVAGDHLTLTNARGTMIAIPRSPTDFLAFFNADDVAEYCRVHFSVDGGVTRYTLSEAWGEPLGTLEKAP